MFAADNISTPIPFQADVPDDVALAEGDEAADRIVAGATMIDHLKVARALMVGSRIAAKEAGTDRGKPYNVAFGKWLREHPKLAAVNEQNRAAALWCLDPVNWPRVEKYLATLDVEERQMISLRTVRRRLPPRPPAPKPADQATVAAGPAVPAAAAAHEGSKDKGAPAVPAAAAPAGGVREAADRAEVATLKAEVWRLKDKLDQIAIYLVEKPPPKAEDRPYVATRVWPLGDFVRRPKDVPQRQIVEPGADLTGDPAFALRKEEFEQWLIRRREKLEMRYAAREAELAKAFEAKITARIEARMAREDTRGRVFTEAEFKRIWSCLHPDSRKAVSEKTLAAAFNLLESKRDRLVFRDKSKSKGKGKAASAPDVSPEPPQEGGVSAGVLS